MASTPNFASTPKIGVADISTANTARDGTGTIGTVLTAAAAGTRVEKIVLKASGDPANSTVTIFLHDGSTAHIFDEFDIGDPAAGSTTAESYRIEKAYRDLVLPSGWSVRAAVTVAPSAGVVKVFALGADLT